MWLIYWACNNSPNPVLIGPASALLFLTPTVLAWYLEATHPCTVCGVMLYHITGQTHEV